jgi:hypothetical protein
VCKLCSIYARHRSVAVLVLQGNSFRERKEKLEVIEQYDISTYVEVVYCVSLLQSVLIVLCLGDAGSVCEFVAKCFNRSLPRGCRECVCEFIAKCFNRSLPRGCRECSMEEHVVTI